MRVFLITPETDEASVLRLLLQKGGFVIQSTSTMSQLISTWPEDPLDLILISLDEINENLIEEIKSLRHYVAVPIVLIADPLPESQLVALLDGGIDLVINRPYGVRSLQAQIRSLIRRTQGTALFRQPNLTQADLTLDPSDRTVKVGDRDPVRLTHLEFRLLHTLITNPGQVIPSETLVDYVWGYSGEGNRYLVRGLVQRLRTKIEPDIHNPKYILNSPGIGYSFKKNNPSR